MAAQTLGRLFGWEKRLSDRLYMDESVDVRAGETAKLNKLTAV